MIALIILGILAGALSGIIGIGGGVLIVPALIYIFSFSQKVAQGTTLALLLAPIGIFAVWTYYKAGFVDLRVALLLGIGFLIGSYFGARFAVHAPTDLLAKIFGIIIILIGIKMVIGK
jgi:uncharacterized membrane protein YfcA